MRTNGIGGPDFPGRGQAALGELFDGLVAEVQHMFDGDKDTVPAAELPEPMLGAMGRLSDD